MDMELTKTDRRILAREDATKVKWIPLAVANLRKWQRNRARSGAKLCQCGARISSTCQYCKGCAEQKTAEFVRQLEADLDKWTADAERLDAKADVEHGDGMVTLHG